MADLRLMQIIRTSNASIEDKAALNDYKLMHRELLKNLKELEPQDEQTPQEAAAKLIEMLSRK